METRPTIEVLDNEGVELTEGIEVPKRFRARFEDTISMSFDIEMVQGAPIVRSITMTTDSDDLAATDLRRPLRSQLVPAAMAAACREQLIGPSAETLAKLADVVAQSPEGQTLIGPITVVGRLRRRSGEYRKAAQSTRQQRPGRPRHVTDPDELELIAVAYLERRSLADVMSKLPYLSKTTAWRRVNEARNAGLVPADT
jgi:hypothetical protein